MWFKWKYENPAKPYSKSSISCTSGAFGKCAPLHAMKIAEIRSGDMQAMLHQMFKYAAEYDIIEKDYSQYIKITRAEDDEARVPFTPAEIQSLWENAGQIPYAV